MSIPSDADKNIRENLDRADQRNAEEDDGGGKQASSTEQGPRNDSDDEN